MELKTYHFWMFEVHSTINSANEHGPDVLNTFFATRVSKLKILQRMYELISAFATQKFCSFWKTISPSILHTKNWGFQHVLSFSSSLAAWSQFISNMCISVSKAVCKEQKCRQWRQHQSPYTVAFIIFCPLLLKIKLSTSWGNEKVENNQIQCK